MATYHIDLYNGNDSNDGTSWATAWKTFHLGATAARTAPGDFIKVSKTPDPVNTGMDFTVHSRVNRVLTQATQTVSTTPGVGNPYTFTNSSLQSGDLVYFYNTIATNSGRSYTGFWEIESTGAANTFRLVGSAIDQTTGTNSGRMVLQNGRTIKLSSTNFKVVDNVSTGWVTSGGTIAYQTTGESDYFFGRFTFPASPTTNTRYFYKDLGATGLDLSAYSRLTMHFLTNNTTFAAGAFRICLCSDQAGQVVVNDLPLPASSVFKSTTSGLVLDFGAPLGSNIKSIAIYSGTGTVPGSAYLQLNNIVAVKEASDPSSLTHVDLIGSNTVEQYWYSIGYFANQGYIGVKSCNTSLLGTYDSRTMLGDEIGTRPLYKKEAIASSILGPGSVSFQIMEAGTAQNPIVWEGGWDPVTDTKNGETMLDGQGSNYITMGTGLGSFTGLSIRNFSCVRGAYAIQLGSSASPFNSAQLNTLSGQSYGVCTAPGAQVSISVKTIMNTIVTLGNQNQGSNLVIDYLVGNISNLTLGGYQNDFTIKNCLRNNANLYLSGQECILRCTKVRDNSPTATSADGVFTNTGMTADNQVIILDAPVTKASVFDTITSGWNPPDYTNARLAGSKMTFSDGYVPAALVTDGGNFVLATMYGETGYGWRGKIMSANRTSVYPMGIRISRIALKANQEVTLSLRVRNESSNVKGSLYVAGGQIAGVEDLIESQFNGSPLNEWQTVSLTFTPTESGVIEVQFRMWLESGSTGTCCFDNLGVS